MSRNGLTGELLKASGPSGPLKYQPQRVRRTRLQSALISKVPDGVIKLNKKLSSLEKLENGCILLVFEDGTEAISDLVVGGDGIRSVCLHSPMPPFLTCVLTHFQVVREHIFPDHSIRFTGQLQKIIIRDFIDFFQEQQSSVSLCRSIPCQVYHSYFRQHHGGMVQQDIFTALPSTILQRLPKKNGCLRLQLGTLLIQPRRLVKSSVGEFQLRKRELSHFSP